MKMMIFQSMMIFNFKNVNKNGIGKKYYDI